MEYDEQHGAVTYHSDKPSGPTAGSETSDALEFLARLTSHIPDKNQVLQRYYGHYSSRVRAMRRKAAEKNEDYEEHPLVTVEPEPEAVREAKRRWANLLRHILEVEPLRCPRCGEEMRIVSFITEPKTIDRILEYLRRRTETSRRRQRAPPRRCGSRRPARLQRRATPESPNVRRYGDRWVARRCRLPVRQPITDRIAGQNHPLPLAQAACRTAQASDGSLDSSVSQQHTWQPRKQIPSMG